MRLIAIVSLSCLTACGGEPALDAAPCSDCGIELTPLITIDFTGATASPTEYSTRVAMDAALTRFAVTSGSFPSEVMVFGRDGEILGTIGRPGPGPEEFRRIRALAYDAADSLWVFDPGNRKVNVYDPNLAYARSIPIRGTVHAAVLADANSFAVWATVSNEPVSTWLLGHDGTLQPVTSPDSTYLTRTNQETAIATDGVSRLWVSSIDQYRIETWTTAGEHVGSIVRSPEWFTADFDDQVKQQFEGILASASAVLSLTLDPAGRLWVLGGGPQADVDPTRLIGATEDQLPELVPHLVDHIIEVLDSETGELLSTRRFDYQPMTFLPGALAYWVRSDSIGQTYVEVVRLELAQDDR